MSPLQQILSGTRPTLPTSLQQPRMLQAIPTSQISSIPAEIQRLFPLTHAQPTVIAFIPSHATVEHPVLRVGVVLSGGQASGGHNVIAGLYDALKELNPQSRLFGFLNGPKGIIENKQIEITEETLAPYRNQGGFDLIGSGRTKIKTPEQLKQALLVVRQLQLDGLLIVGGDDSNTNAAILAEYFLAHQCKTSVVGVPKTIDGDLKNDEIEISFGFDTAAKTYSESIGNILKDCLSAKKYYYFIKLMGRSASHLTLECALQTHPNLALIGEEIAAHKKTLQDLIIEIADLICQRAEQGKDYGVILIPEGLIEFIPECKTLIQELNQLMADKTEASDLAQLFTRLTPASASCLKQLPIAIQNQLLLDRDEHGNVQLSKIETERLLLNMVEQELKRRKQQGLNQKFYRGTFSGQPLFFGYEGRSGFPSNFDSQYCYALGYTAALAINHGLTGYICYLKNLATPVEQWQLRALNLVTLLHIENRNTKEIPVIAKALVDLNGTPFKAFAQQRQQWAFADLYINPGPIQFFGPKELTESITHTLALNPCKGG